MRNARVILGLSGGVDSAVSAVRLMADGYVVKCVFMKCWSEDDWGGPCPWAEDQAMAVSIARQLGLPIETWNFEREFRRRVFEEMLHEYNQGRTPNPDLICNREIKFALFAERALREADYIATGHYARSKDGQLRRGSDPAKDQSYFLAAVRGATLKRTLFPIGELKKTEVRRLARQAKLPNSERADSVGICFVGEKNMPAFLSQHLRLIPGPITTPAGVVVGRHRGLPLYTIGQRHGFGRDLDHQLVARVFGGGRALEVVSKDSRRQTLFVNSKSTRAVRRHIQLESEHWISEPPRFPWAGMVKLRYRQPDIKAELVREALRLCLTCSVPVAGAAPGQYAVFYEKDICLGCAVITELQASMD